MNENVLVRGKYIFWIKKLWPLLLPLWLFVPGIAGFPFSSADAPYSDLAISHYPNALFLIRTLLEDHIVPLWSPTILSGYPFAANPLAGLWYLPGWFAYLFPLPLGFNLSVIFHLLWGGVGMYLLLRQEGLKHVSALFGALAFESLPKIFAHYGAGHITLIYALVWTPWLLLSTFTQIALPRWVKILSPGIVLGIIFLADPRWSVFAGLLWVGYAIFSWKKSKTNILKLLSNFLSQSILAALLAAPLAIPLLEYTRLSTRNLLTSNDVLLDSLPPFRLLGLLFPDFGGHHEWMLYPGAIVIILAVVAMLTLNQRFHSTFWILTFAITLIYSLGSNVPGMTALTQLPVLNLLRVPPRALFLSGMALSTLAASGVDILLNDPANLPGRRIKLTLMGLMIFVAMVTLGIGVMTGIWELNFIWGSIAVIVASLVVWFRVDNRAPLSLIILLIFGIGLLDWGSINASVLTFQEYKDVISENQEAAKYLADQKELFRIYSPSYSLPQQTAAWYDLSLADGVDPLQLDYYAKFMEEATGVEFQGYSVTLPPFANGDPQYDNAIYSPNASLLGLLNVRFLVADFDLPADDLILRKQFGATRIYENLKSGPRTWVQVDEFSTRKASITDWKPNRVRIVADGPGRLILSEIAYPGWRVDVDGNPSSLEIFNGLIRAVQLPPGNHEVEFYFFPTSVYAGIAFFILGILVIGIHYLRTWRK
ncbi:MAG: YfhO family protein [Anaerolineae bacterium]|nr:YfhO family protein [Anaerolineae bacterium]